MRIATYIVYLNATEYEEGSIGLDDIPGLIEYDYQGTESHD